MKLKRSFIAVLLALFTAVSLVAAGSVAEAAAGPKIFRPEQPPLSTTGAVREARTQLARLNRKKNPGKNYIRQASRRNSKIVKQLNTRRSKRNKQRAAYLQDKISEFSSGLINGINDEFDRDSNRIKEEYDRDVDRVKRNLKGKRRQEALRRLKAAYVKRIDTLTRVKQQDLDRANDRIAATKAANNKLYEKISERESSDIKIIKGRLRDALADLRDRG